MKLAHKKGSRVPKFRFEQKSFNIVKCNTDLAETELEIEVVRGIGYNVSKPKDVDTYVKVEFPYPQVFLRDFFYKNCFCISIDRFDFLFLFRIDKIRKHRIETKQPSFMIQIIQNIMKNSSPKFNQKFGYVSASSNAMALNSKSTSEGAFNVITIN